MKFICLLQLDSLVVAATVVVHFFGIYSNQLYTNCNAFYSGARIVARISKFTRITSILKKLH